MSLTRRFSAFMRGIRNRQFEDLEVLVRDATSNDSAGAPDKLVWNIIQAASHGSNDFALIASMLWKRISDHAHPRHVYKGLTLLFHLIQHGPSQSDWRENAKTHMEELVDLKQYCLYKKAGTLVNSIRRAAATIEDLALHPEKIDQMKLAHKQKKARRQAASGAKAEEPGSGANSPRSFGGAWDKLDTEHQSSLRDSVDDKEKTERPAKIEVESPRSLESPNPSRRTHAEDASFGSLDSRSPTHKDRERRERRKEEQRRRKRAELEQPHKHTPSPAAAPAPVRQGSYSTTSEGRDGYEAISDADFEMAVKL